MPLQARRGYGHARASEDLARALLSFNSGEAEQDGLGRIGSGGDQPVALELLRELVAGLSPAIELEMDGDAVVGMVSMRDLAKSMAKE